MTKIRDEKTNKELKEEDVKFLDEATLDCAKKIICAYWSDVFGDDQSNAALGSVLFDVRSAKPEDLIEHYETVAKILLTAAQIAKERREKNES